MLSANGNGATEAPQWRFEWGSNYGTLTCANCANPYFRATAPGDRCGAYNVVIRASFGGFDSDAFYIDIQSPNLMAQSKTEYWQPPAGGWGTDIHYKLFDTCGRQMTRVEANEVFTSCQQHNGSNWDAPLEATGFSDLVFDQFTGSWLLKDMKSQSL